MMRIDVWPTMKKGVVTLHPSTPQEYELVVADMADIEVDCETEGTIHYSNGVEIRKPKELRGLAE